MSSVVLSHKAALAAAVIQNAVALSRSNRADLVHTTKHSNAEFLEDFGTVYLNLGRRSGTLSASLATRNSVVFFNEPGEMTFRVDSAGNRVELPEYNPEEDWDRIQTFLDSHGGIETIFIQGVRPDDSVSRWMELHIDLCAHYAHDHLNITFVII